MKEEHEAVCWDDGILTYPDGAGIIQISVHLKIKKKLPLKSKVNFTV